MQSMRVHAHAYDINWHHRGHLLMRLQLMLLLDICRKEVTCIAWTASGVCLVTGSADKSVVCQNLDANKQACLMSPYAGAEP